MENRKIIVVSEDTEKTINNICDSALKFSGMQIRGHINGILKSVKEKVELKIDNAS
jgi:hypothetical protein